MHSLLKLHVHVLAERFVVHSVRSVGLRSHVSVIEIEIVPGVLAQRVVEASKLKVLKRIVSADHKRVSITRDH